MVNPHAMLYAGRTQAIDLVIPWQHFKRALDLRRNGIKYNTLGTLALMVMNVLTLPSGATNTSAAISVFARFPCPEFSILNPTKQSIVPQGNTFVKHTEKTFNLSDVMLDGTVDAGTGDTFKGGDFDVKASSADKPNWAVNPLPMQESFYPRGLNAVNVEYANYMDLSGGEVPKVTSLDTGIKQDECSMKYLTQKLSYVGSFHVDTTRKLGDAVYEFDLAPCSQMFTASTGTAVQFDLMSYVTAPATFWRGSLLYKFIFVCSDLHMLRVRFCSHVMGQSAGLSTNEAFGQYTADLNIRGITEITVGFPWRSDTDWKLVPNGSASDVFPYSMGQGSVRILTPLQAQGVASGFDVNVFRCGGEDYRISYMGNNLADLLVAFTGIEAKLKAIREKRKAAKQARKTIDSFVNVVKVAK